MNIPTKKIQIGVVFFTVMTVFITSSLHADIYIYKDSQGVLHFSNVPTSPKYTNYIMESDPNTGIGYSDTSYDDLIEEAARKNGLSFHLLKAIILVESYFNPYAVSKKGALGLMQIMPENLEPLKVEDPFDPRDNIMAGAGYIKTMIERFNGKLELALAAYNAGPSAVEKYAAIPPYRETQEYVQKVLKVYSRYKNTL